MLRFSVARLEVRETLGSLKRSMGSHLLAWALLSGGVGATALVGAVGYGVLRAPKPYRGLDRTFVVHGMSTTSTTPTQVAQQELDELGHRLGPQFRIASSSDMVVTLSDLSSVRASKVSKDFFEVCEAAPLQGSLASLAVNDVAVSRRFWRSHLGAVPLSGATRLVTAAGDFRVSAVMPEGFDWPRAADIWIVAPPEPIEHDVLKRTLTGLIRVPSSGLVPRRVDLNGQSGRWVALQPLSEALYGRTTRTAALLVVIAGLILLVVIASLSAILAVEVQTRAPALRLKSTLGAPGVVLWTSISLQALALAVPGILGAGSLCAAYGSVPLKLLPIDIPSARQALQDGLIVSCSVGAVGAACVLVVVIMGVRFGREVLGASALRRHESRAMRVLALQAAAATAAVVLGFGFGREFIRQQIVLPVRSPESVRFAWIGLRTGSDRARLTRELLDVEEALRANPAVEDVGAISIPPYANRSFKNQVALHERPEHVVMPELRRVDPGYFDVMETPLVRGRLLSDTDIAGGPLVAVINQRLEEMLVPGERSLVGASLDILSLGTATVIGVVADHGDLEEGSLVIRPEAYVAVNQSPTLSGSLLVRVNSSGGPQTNLLRTIEDHLVATSVRMSGSLADLRDRIATDVRFYSTMVKVIAVIASGAALGGAWSLLSVIAFARRKEDAIRLALGATLSRLALRSALRAATAVSAGMAAGLLLGFVAIQLLARIAEIVTPTVADVVVTIAIGVVSGALIGCGVSFLAWYRLDARLLR